MRDEVSNMTDSEAIWYSRGYELAKSEGWSVSQKEAISEKIGNVVMDSVAATRSGYASVEEVTASAYHIIEKALAELEAITKGSEQ